MLDQVRGYSDDDITALSLKFYERAVQAGTVAPVGPDAESLSLQGGEAAGEESQEGGEESGGAQSDDLSSGVEMEGGEAASWAGGAVHSWGEMIPNYGECCDVSGLSLHVGEKGTSPALCPPQSSSRRPLRPAASLASLTSGVLVAFVQLC